MLNEGLLGDDACLECVIEIVGMFDDYALYTAVNGTEGSFNFGNHAFIDGSICTQGCKALSVDSRDNAEVIVYICEYTILLKAENKVCWLYL